MSCCGCELSPEITCHCHELRCTLEGPLMAACGDAAHQACAGRVLLAEVIKLILLTSPATE